MPSSCAKSATARSPLRSSIRISRRLGSAIALKTSDVVAARAISPSYSYMGICKVHDRSVAVELPLIWIGAGRTCANALGVPHERFRGSASDGPAHLWRDSFGSLTAPSAWGIVSGRVQDLHRAGAMELVAADRVPAARGSVRWHGNVTSQRSCAGLSMPPWPVPRAGTH